MTREDIAQVEITRGFDSHEAQVTADALPLEVCLNRISAELVRYKEFSEAMQSAQAILYKPLDEFRNKLPEV